MTDRCDENIYQNGRLVCIIADRDGDAIEDLVITARQFTGVSQVDWFYAGGRGAVKAIGGDLELKAVRGFFRPYQNAWLKVIEDDLPTDL